MSFNNTACACTLVISRIIQKYIKCNILSRKISLKSNNRTTTNCAVQPRVTSDGINAESDNSNGNGSAGVVAEVVAEVKVDPTMQIGQGDVKPNICELPESTKPTVHFSKKKKRQSSYKSERDYNPETPVIFHITQE